MCELGLLVLVVLMVLVMLVGGDGAEEVEDGCVGGNTLMIDD